MYRLRTKISQPRPQPCVERIRCSSANNYRSRDSCWRRSRPESKSATVREDYRCAWNRIFSLEAFGGNHAVQPSSTAPLVKPSIDMPAAAVIANCCDAHPGAPSCGSNAVLSPVATSRSEAQGLSSFQSESLSPAVVAAPTTTPSWCASISSIVFNSPGEAAKARGTCGLSSPRVIPSVARHREFRAQVPDVRPPTHHGRN